MLRVWQQLKASGDVYEGQYTGYYCRSDEAFLRPDAVSTNAAGDCVSKESGNVVEVISETNHLFR